MYLYSGHFLIAPFGDLASSPRPPSPGREEGKELGESAILAIIILAWD